MIGPVRNTKFARVKPSAFERSCTHISAISDSKHLRHYLTHITERSDDAPRLLIGQIAITV